MRRLLLPAFLNTDLSRGRNITAVGCCDGGECGLTQSTPVPDIDNNGEATVIDADLTDGNGELPEDADGDAVRLDEVRAVLHCCHDYTHDIVPWQMEPDEDEGGICNGPAGRPDNMLMHIIKGFAESDVRDATVSPHQCHAHC